MENGHTCIETKNFFVPFFFWFFSIFLINAFHSFRWSYVKLLENPDH